MVPACSFLLSGHSHWHGGLASQRIQRQRSDSRELLCAFPCPCAVRILSHGDIQHPLNPVFNLPMGAKHSTQALRIRARDAWERAPG
jgi:hypothetical protein